MRKWIVGLSAAAAATLVIGAVVVVNARNDADPGPPIGPGPTAPPGERTSQAPDPALLPLAALRLETVADGLDLPVDVAVAPGSTDLFIVEKTGRVRVIADGELLEEPFLDITAEVETAGLEQGLLDLEFHPGYAENGRLFVHFTEIGGDSRIVEYEVSSDRHRVLSGSAEEVLKVDQPHQYHNGGMLQFGPDGYLYIALGDGGGIGDSFGNGQSTLSLLGGISRIDVDAASPYAIPPDNPFVGIPNTSAEVWAYGLRNPWRIWIDPVDGLVYVADVGQDAWEEVNVVPLGGGGYNFGWPIREGPDCFEAEACGGGFTDPIFQYAHESTCSIIGGPVYRGRLIPELWGHFIYGDFCAGWVRSIRVDDGRVIDEMDLSKGLDRIGFIQSFGLDANGELLLLTAEGGVYRMVPERGG